MSLPPSSLGNLGILSMARSLKLLLSLLFVPSPLPPCEQEPETINKKYKYIKKGINLLILNISTADMYYTITTLI